MEKSISENRFCSDFLLLNSFADAFQTSGQMFEKIGEVKSQLFRRRLLIRNTQIQVPWDYVKENSAHILHGMLRKQLQRERGNRLVRDVLQNICFRNFEKILVNRIAVESDFSYVLDQTGLRHIFRKDFYDFC